MKLTIFSTIIMIISLICGITIVACSQTDNGVPKFTVGQIITTKIGNHKGMVLSTGCMSRTCNYTIRFESSSLGTKYPALFTLETMYEIEIEEAK